VLDLDIIADADYEQAIIRERQSSSDSYTEVVHYFEVDSRKEEFFVEIWDEQDATLDA
jgi:hypothetical protein